MAKAWVVSRTASASWLDAMPWTAPTSVMHRWSSSPTGCFWKKAGSCFRRWENMRSRREMVALMPERTMSRVPL
jgi:hypothetical protein